MPVDAAREAMMYHHAPRSSKFHNKPELLGATLQWKRSGNDWLLRIRQMIGRVLRPADGKPDAIILDHSGAVFRHGFAEDPVEWTLRPDRADGELGLVRNGRAQAHVYDPAARARWHGQLAYIAMERGYKRGWVAHQYKQKFGCYPAWGSEPEPIAPTLEVLSWVRSRMIAYAKRQSAPGRGPSFWLAAPGCSKRPRACPSLRSAPCSWSQAPSRRRRGERARHRARPWALRHRQHREKSDAHHDASSCKGRV
jgi:hypothetical protein